ncbi:MAG: hypothetical protein ACRD03_17460 [Acidimicrobiales bacterium]
MIAIVDNGSGDYLVLARDGEYPGDAAFIWDHETDRMSAAGALSDLLDPGGDS